MKAVILDMYGVVIRDSYGELMPFVNRHFPRHTRDDVYPHWQQGAVGAMSGEELWRAMGFTGDLSAVERDYLDAIAVDREFFPAASLLRQRYKLALLSNDIGGWNSYLRQKHRLDDAFDVVVVSGDMGVKKPDPSIYLETARRLCVEPRDCVFVDDILHNLEGAKAVGMDTVLFNRLGVSYDGKVVYSFPELTALIEAAYA